MSFEDSYVLPSVWVPEANGIIVTPTCENLPVRAKRNTVDVICMLVKRIYVLSGVWVPELDGIIPTSACEELSIGTEGDTKDVIGVSLEGPYGLSSV